VHLPPKNDDMKPQLTTTIFTRHDDETVVSAVLLYWLRHVKTSDLQIRGCKFDSQLFHFRLWASCSHKHVPLSSNTIVWWLVTLFNLEVI